MVYDKPHLKGAAFILLSQLLDYTGLPYVLLLFHLQSHRAVVATHNVGEDLGFFEAGEEGAGGKKIVYAPADVALARQREVAPPGVVSWAFGKKAKCVDEASFEYRVDALALLSSVAVLAFICFGIGQVIGRMGSVKVATEDDRLVLLELFHVCQEGWVPLLVAQFEPTKVGFGVWGIRRDHEIVIKLDGHYAPLLVWVAITVFAKPKLLVYILGEAERD